MATVTMPIPVVMEFEQNSEKIFKEVRHYDLVNGKDQFSEKLNISKDQDIFYGTIKDKQNFLLFRYTENGKMLRLYYFQNFYTRSLTAFLNTFKKHYLNERGKRKTPLNFVQMLSATITPQI